MCVLCTEALLELIQYVDVREAQTDMIWRAISVWNEDRVEYISNRILGGHEHAIYAEKSYKCYKL